jgi:urease accessory protein
MTPPEFRGLDSTENPVGRVGGARIELLRSGDGTGLGTCYQQIPVRVMPPFQFATEPAALLYLINLTAGLLDGDAHRVEVMARAGSRAVVTGQSATRVHPALDSFATQQWVVEVEDDACLVVLPGPTIPFRGCRYFQRGRVELASRARLIWGDIWLPGRYDRGSLSERFQFERIAQDFEVRRAGLLVYRDRFKWDGPWTVEDVRWYWGGELACGSLFVGGPVPETLPEATRALRRSVYRLDTGECCVRWVGPPGAVTADLVRTGLGLAGQWTGSPHAPPWLLASSELVPNHWFSSPAA